MNADEGRRTFDRAVHSPAGKGVTVGRKFWAIRSVHIIDRPTKCCRPRASVGEYLIFYNQNRLVSRWGTQGVIANFQPIRMKAIHLTLGHQTGIARESNLSQGPVIATVTPGFCILTKRVVPSGEKQGPANSEIEVRANL